MTKINKKTQEKITNPPTHQLMYLPILKGKQGELGALQNLSINDKARTLPLIEIPGIPWDFDTETPSKTIEDHLANVLPKILEAWGTEYPLLIDTMWLPQQLDNGENTLDFVVNSLREMEVQAIPVLALDDINSRNALIESNFFRNYPEACIRVVTSDIDTDATLSIAMTEFHESTRLDKENIHLLVDFKDMTPDQSPMYATLARLSINSIENLERFKSFSLSITSFPENLSEHGADTLEEIPRAEWQLWRNLVQGRLRRKPIFADYAISSSRSPSIDPRYMRMSANLRYTGNNSWIIVKGRAVRTAGYEQFNQLCRQLVGTPHYAGPDFSWGDSVINEKAENGSGPGNATTWRQIGTNRHITKVISQVSSMEAEP